MPGRGLAIVVKNVFTGIENHKTDGDKENMRRIAIALVDDDETFLHLVSAHLKLCLDKVGVRREISLFTSPDKFREAFYQRGFDIVFLDIFFPGHNGMDVAKEIRGHNGKCLIVFLTVSSDYAVQGYGVHAANYLVKPIAPDALEVVMKDCLERIRKSENQFMVLKNGPELLQVNVDDVVYFESRGRHVSVYGDKGEMFARFGKLSDMAPSLPPVFIRIHQSYVVNITRIISMKNYHMHLDTGKSLPISRPYRKAAAAAFFNAAREGL